MEYIISVLVIRDERKRHARVRELEMSHSLSSLHGSRGTFLKEHQSAEEVYLILPLDLPRVRRVRVHALLAAACRFKVELGLMGRAAARRTCKGRVVRSQFLRVEAVVEGPCNYERRHCAPESPDDHRKRGSGDRVRADNFH